MNSAIFPAFRRALSSRAATAFSASSFLTSPIPSSPKSSMCLKKRCCGMIEKTVPMSEKHAFCTSACENCPQKLCHNCDAKPVLVAKTDFFDDVRLLITRNLLNRRKWPKFPCYQNAVYRSGSVGVWFELFGSIAVIDLWNASMALGSLC